MHHCNHMEIKACRGHIGYDGIFCIIINGCERQQYQEKKKKALHFYIYRNALWLFLELISQHPWTTSVEDKQSVR